LITTTTKPKTKLENVESNSFEARIVQMGLINCKDKDVSDNNETRTEVIQ